MALSPALTDPLVHDAERLRETARELLSRPPYTTEEPGPVTDVLLRLRSRVADVLEALLDTLVGNATLAWSVVGLATVAAVWLVLRWGRHVGRDAHLDAAVDLAAPRPAADWYEEARRHADAADWPAAIRAGYLAVVADLVSQGVIEDARGLTVGEIDRRVEAAIPDRAAAIAAAGGVFEDTWYGHRPADRGGYDRVIEAVTSSRTSSRT